MEAKTACKWRKTQELNKYPRERLDRQRNQLIWDQRRLWWWKNLKMETEVEPSRSSNLEVGKSSGWWVRWFPQSSWEKEKEKWVFVTPDGEEWTGQLKLNKFHRKYPQLDVHPHQQGCLVCFGSTLKMFGCKIRSCWNLRWANINLLALLNTSGSAFSPTHPPLLRLLLLRVSGSSLRPPCWPLSCQSTMLQPFHPQQSYTWSQCRRPLWLKRLGTQKQES